LKQIFAQGTVAEVMAALLSTGFGRYFAWIAVASPIIVVLWFFGNAATGSVTGSGWQRMLRGWGANAELISSVHNLGQF
jgi:hypothetical protein